MPRRGSHLRRWSEPGRSEGGILDRAEEFLRHLEFGVNASPQTVRCYRTDLREFERFLRSRGPAAALNSIDHQTIRAYLFFLHERGVSRSTVARKLASVRSYFRHLKREGLIRQNPALMVATPRLLKRLPHPMTQDEVESLLDSAFGKEPRDTRDRAILELLYATGIRVGELVRADLGDFDLGGASREGMLLVYGKGRKERMVPIGSKAVAALRTYIRARGAQSSYTPRRAADRQKCPAHSRLAATPGRRAAPCFAALASSFVRHSHAQRGRRPALDPGAARAFLALDDPEIYGCHHQQTPGGLSPRPSTCPRRR